MWRDRLVAPCSAKRFATTGWSLAMMGARPPSGSEPSAPFPLGRGVIRPSDGGAAAMIHYFLDRDQNDFFVFFLSAPLLSVPAMPRSAAETLLPLADATTGLPAFAAAWLALASSGMTKVICLPRAFSNSAFETVPSRPPSRLATKTTRAFGATCWIIV